MTSATAHFGMLYFSVGEPHPSSWHRNRAGALTPWPPGTTVGPALARADLPAGWGERVDRVLTWQRDVAAPWLAGVHAAIDADPLACAARFARWHGRCCCCAARLQDGPARLVGACTGCRDRLPPDAVTELLDATRAGGRGTKNRQQGDAP